MCASRENGAQPTQQQGQVVDLMAVPMTPEAMELRASPKAPRLTLLVGGGVGGDYIMIHPRN